MLKTGMGVNGSAFYIAGMNSSDDPMFLNDRAYFSAMNVVNRGGIVKVRPGYLAMFDLPDGNLQGACYYRPLESAPFIVFAVEGIIYVSKAPFISYAPLPNIEFFHGAKFVYWQVATKSVEQDSEGVPIPIDPVRLLVMQDGGYTRAAYWDGSTARHLDPTDDETPLGGPMAWSGDRLWVARGNRLFAGDINDPLKFTEDTYLAEASSFFMVEPITSMAEIPGLATPQLAVFTATNSQVFQSGIRDRSLWSTQVSPPFQSNLFPSVGCVAHRSLISQYGLLWWQTSTGLTNFNAAGQARVSSVLAPQDIEMAVSKGNMSPGIDRMASAAMENYGLFSVPSGSKWNQHTWVMDKAVIAGLGKDTLSTWNSFWTGTYPVEWAVGPVDNVQRIFHVSKDDDGKNRLWETFISDRQDNQSPITCYVETKTHIDFGEKATGLDLKRFKFAEVTFCEIKGEVSGTIYWAGTHGRYKKISDFVFEAEIGELQMGVDVEEGDPIYGYATQSRTIRTPELDPLKVAGSTCTSCGTEGPRADHIDVGFSLLIVWSGRAALRSYRIFADSEPEKSVGECSINERYEENIVLDALCDPGE
jgi:hypothetical protein